MSGSASARQLAEGAFGIVPDTDFENMVVALSARLVEGICGAGGYGLTISTGAPEPSASELQVQLQHESFRLKMDNLGTRPGLAIEELSTGLPWESRRNRASIWPACVSYSK